jgi:hypothetical protein
MNRYEALEKWLSDLGVIADPKVIWDAAEAAQESGELTVVVPGAELVVTVEVTRGPGYKDISIKDLRHS